MTNHPRFLHEDDLRKFLNEEYVRETTFETYANLSTPTGMGTTDFTNKDSEANSAGYKMYGRSYWSIQLAKPLFASGPAPTDPWVDATGAVVYTPS